MQGAGECIPLPRNQRGGAGSPAIWRLTLRERMGDTSTQARLLSDHDCSPSLPCSYRMDYMKFVNYHRETNADITIGCIAYGSDRAKEFGLMKIDDKRRVTVSADPVCCLCGVGCYAAGLRCDTAGWTPSHALLMARVTVCCVVTAGCSTRNTRHQGMGAAEPARRCRWRVHAHSRQRGAAEGCIGPGLMPTLHCVPRGLAPAHRPAG